MTLVKVIEHLGFARVGWTTRSLRPQIDAFLATGALVSFRRFRIDFLKLTPTGGRRLAQARRGQEVVLSESRNTGNGATRASGPPSGSARCASSFGKRSMKQTGCSPASELLARAETIVPS